MTNTKKIGLLGCLAAGIGCIIGSGIFGSLPEAINSVGSNVTWALLCATFVVVLRSIARIYVVSALPTSASQFMHATKLMHPHVGALISINAFLIPSMIALFGVLFATYFKDLFPGVPLGETGLSVLLISVFTAIAWFGNHTTVSINNVMVGALLVAILLYVVVGIPNIDPANISFHNVVGSGMTLNMFSAVVGILTSSLSGASAVAEIADDVKKPGRNVPLTLALCPVIVCLLYVLMAAVTLGGSGSNELESLSQVAGRFFSPGLMIFFVAAGPIAGIITSMIPVALSNVAVFEFSAKNRIYPGIFAKRNKHGVSYFSLFLVAAISIGIVSTGATFGPIMTVFSFSNTFAELPNTIMPIFAHKKYPKSCNNSFMKMPLRFMQVISVITFLICAYLCYEMVLTMDAAVWGLLAAVYVVGYLYYFARIGYLRKKEGYDLVAVLKRPFAPWETHEKELSSKG